MSASLRKLLFQIGTVVVAIGLLYLALRGIAFEEVASVFRDADYRWVLPLAGIALFSHVLRAWRWRYLLDALPEKREADSQVPVAFKSAFFSVMIGYMVNSVTPRLGEIARAANMAKTERLKLTSVFGTVAAERVLDVLVLGCSVVSVIALLWSESTFLQEVLFAPLQQRVGHSTILLVVVAMGLALGIGSLYGLYKAQPGDFLFGLRQRVLPLWQAFSSGLLTVLQTPKRWPLVFLTLAIWTAYLFMAYIPLFIFNLVEPYALSLADAWVLMVLGSVAYAIPTPGSIGPYHALTTFTLVALHQTPQEAAASYAIFVHEGQLILYVLVGFICVLLQGSSFSSLLSSTTIPTSSKASS